MSKDNSSTLDSRSFYSAKQAASLGSISRGIHAQKQESGGFSSMESKGPTTESTAKPEFINHSELLPYFFRFKSPSDDYFLIRNSRHMRKQQSMDPFYFKWGLWLRIGGSLCMCDILETLGQLQAKLGQLKFKASIENIILRLGIEPGYPCNKLALKVPLADQKEFYLSICTIAMGNAFFHLSGTQVPIIGLSMALKEDYGVVKIWLGISKSAETEPQQILRLLQNLASQMPDKHPEHIESAVFMQENGDSYQVFHQTQSLAANLSAAPESARQSDTCIFFAEKSKSITPH